MTPRMSESSGKHIAILTEVDAFFRKARIRYWLRGGCALDFLLGQVTREHGDIDLVSWKRNEARIERLFREHGFAVTSHGASTDFEKGAVEVNVLFIEPGPGIVYTAGFRDEPRWNEDVLRGPMRRLAGLRCRTITPRGLLEELEKTPRWLGRPPRPQDAQTKAMLRKLLATDPSTPARRSLGDFGERVAKAHLESKGYRILATNYRTREGQIDIVAQLNDMVALVEVKTRRGDAMGSALEAIGERQAERLLAAADEFGQDRPGLPEGRRIDLIAIDLDPMGRVVSVEHIESAVEEP